jgi:hypothetical protein
MFASERQRFYVTFRTRPTEQSFGRATQKREALSC